MYKYILITALLLGGCAAIPTLDYQYEQNLVQLRSELDQDVEAGKLNKYEADKIYLERKEYYARDIDRRNARSREAVNTYNNNRNAPRLCNTTGIDQPGSTLCW